MKNFTLPLIASLFLISCNSDVRMIDFSQELENPLTASRYGESLADTLANIIISNDPVLQEAGMREKIESEIEDAKKIAERGHGKQTAGLRGAFLSILEEVEGYALMVDTLLYFSSEFSSDPGIDLHVYLTTAVDPRSVEFPDASSVDLGTIQTVYGGQMYDLKKVKKPEQYRTVVLWDEELKRLYGFAQLSK